MSEPASKMRFHVESRRADAHGSLARGKNAESALGTDVADNPEAFNPGELLRGVVFSGLPRTEALEAWLQEITRM